MLHRVIKIQMLKVSYIKIYKCKNRYREREPGGAGGAGPCAPSPGSFCCLSFLFFLVWFVFFFTKNPQIKTRFPLAPGCGKARGWRWGSWFSSSPEAFPRDSAPWSWLCWSFSREKGEQEEAGGMSRVGSTGWWGGCSPGREKHPIYLWEWPRAGGIGGLIPGGLPSAPPQREKGVMP